MEAFAVSAGAGTVIMVDKDVVCCSIADHELAALVQSDFRMRHNYK